MQALNATLFLGVASGALRYNVAKDPNYSSSKRSSSMDESNIYTRLTEILRRLL